MSSTSDTQLYYAYATSSRPVLILPNIPEILSKDNMEGQFL